MRALVALLLLAPLGAGCLGGEELGPTGSQPLIAAVGPSLVVEVVDVRRAPLAGADVTLATHLGTRTATTDATGAARFADLESGEAQVLVAAPDHVPRSLQVRLPETGELVESVVLLPVREPEPYVLLYEFDGFFECSATALIITGDCFATVREIGREAGQDLGENATNERFVFPFPVEPGWSLIRIAQSWDEPAAGVGTAMRANLEPALGGSNERHNDRYARVDGASPLVLEVRPGEVHPNASDDSLVPPEAGELQVRSFHLGLEEAHNAGELGFLGVGGALQQRFHVVVEVHYG